MNAHKPITAACPLGSPPASFEPSPCKSEVGVSLPKVTCGECNGTGEVSFIALDSTRYEIGECPCCDGEGVVDATCLTCEGPLTATGWCFDCDDLGLTDVIVIVGADGVARLAA